MGKCLSADAEIVLADGSIRTIEEIVRARAAGFSRWIHAGGSRRRSRRRSSTTG
jgi:hypothetical protein